MTYSASSLPRGFRCLASLAHKQAGFSTQAAVDGTARHADQETAIGAGDLTCLPDELAAMLEGMEVKAEVALAYNWSADTARILGYGINRNYVGLDALEIPGTADIVAVGKGRAIVADKKGYEEVEHPRDNKQTLHNALCVARIFDVSEVIVCIHGEIGEPQFVTLDAFDLDAYAESLKVLQTRMVAARKDPQAFEVEGPHCKYCQAFEQCSLKNKLADQVASGAIEKRLGASLNLDDDETAAEVYRFRQRLYQILKRLDARVYARAAQRPIPIGNGKVFMKQVTQGNRQLDAAKVEQAIRELVDATKADEFTAVAIEKETSQAAIERAAKQFAGKGKINALKKSIIERTEALGGVVRKPSEEWGEFDDFGQRQLKAVGG